MDTAAAGNSDHERATRRTTRKQSTRKQAAAPRRGRKPPPEGETPRQRFLRIGAPRMAKAIQGIRLLANLARGNYDWTAEDVERMRATIENEVAKTFAEFERSKGRVKEKAVFTFEG